MPSFDKGGGARTPFGKNEYRRSTKDLKYDSFTMAKSGIPAETIDGYTDQKVLQPGTVIAKITSGADIGKVGVFDSTATDGRQTAANIVGVNDTFLPWQLMERDVEISVCYEGTLKQAWCFEYVAGVRTALTNATRDAVIAALGSTGDLKFR